MAKLTGQNGTGSGLGNTPLGSRMGTPAPGSQDAPPNPKTSSKSKGISPIKRIAATDDADADDLDNDTPERRKMKKKSSYIKKADRDKPTNGSNSNGMLKVRLKTGSRPDLGDRKHSESSERGDGKRDREADDGGDSPKKKKIKLSQGGKERSRASASVEPASAASPE
jgi:ribonuclease P/MRP protein subunit POP1